MCRNNNKSNAGIKEMPSKIFFYNGKNSGCMVIREITIRYNSFYLVYYNSFSHRFHSKV